MPKHSEILRMIDFLVIGNVASGEVVAQENFRSLKMANSAQKASDGAEALQMLRREPPYENMAWPDIILVDFNLLNRDQSAFLQHLKKEPDLAKIPLVVLADSRGHKEIARKQAPQAVAHVVKPMNFERLKEVVAAVEHFGFSVVVFPETLKALS
jgi:CheY-like chemotaxis protein